MSLYTEYQDWFLSDERQHPNLAEQIVFNILKDFTDRRGLRQEWEQIDADIQNEIIQTWIDSTNKTIKEASFPTPL